MPIEEAISALKTYQEMNETIKDLLRRIEEPMSLYILTRTKNWSVRPAGRRRGSACRTGCR